MNRAALQRRLALSSERHGRGYFSCSLSRTQDGCSYPSDSLLATALLSAEPAGHEATGQPRACPAPSPTWSLPCLTTTATTPTGMCVPVTEAFVCPVS